MIVSFSPLLFLFLHDLRHEFAHLFGGTFLHLPHDVGIGSQREARVEVTKHTRYRFYVHAILECQRCECVPLRYNYDKPEKPRISRVFGYLARFFILFQTEKSSHEVVIGPLLYIIKIPAAYAAGIRS